MLKRGALAFYHATVAIIALSALLGLAVGYAQVQPRTELNKALWKLSQEFANDIDCGGGIGAVQFYEFAKEAATIARESKAVR